MYDTTKLKEGEYLVEQFCSAIFETVMLHRELVFGKFWCVAHVKK